MKTPIQISIKGPRKNVLASPIPRSTSALILIALSLAWFEFSPTARAVVPAPAGGYPGENTAEGDNALLSLTTGLKNTANGYNALYSNTEGSFNTAIGAFTLTSGTSSVFNTAIGSGALANNTTGNTNTASGSSALNSNTT